MSIKLNFENYTTVIYETEQNFYEEVPECRFVAYLKEIPEGSLHEYGATKEDALKHLREQFEFFMENLC